MHVVIIDMALGVVVVDDGDVDVVDALLLVLILDLGQTRGVIDIRKALGGVSLLIVVPALLRRMWLGPIWVGLSRLLIHVRNDVFHVPGRQGLLEVARGELLIFLTLYVGHPDVVRILR